MPLCTRCGERQTRNRRDHCWFCVRVNNYVRINNGRQEMPVDRPIIFPTKHSVYPTDAVPGTEQKIQVLERRYLNAEFLFHPGDKMRVNEED